jgi:hypothetical protein
MQPVQRTDDASVIGPTRGQTMTKNENEDNENREEECIEMLQMSGEPLLLDEKDELYGYGVYNVRGNCFVDLPDVSRGFSTEDHLSQEQDETLLKSVARYHSLDDTDHLRIVRVHLDNELDKKCLNELE